MLLLSLQEMALVTGDDGIQQLVDRLEKMPAAPIDWRQIAADRPSGGRFYLNAEIEGRPQRFLSKSLISNMFGPLNFVARPDMVLVTFFPEDESLDISGWADSQAESPLLLY